MNVNDQWMLEKMQQMAAGMAASLPQAGQNTDTPKTEKGESFKDMMDKAVKDQKAEAPKKAETPQKTEKTEPVQNEAPVQMTRKTVRTDPETGMRQIDVTPEEAALLVAGYARLSPPTEDGTVWMVTVRDENGAFRPLEAAGAANVPFLNDVFADTAGQWVLDEITPEFTRALERLLRETGDPRPVQDLLSRLERKAEGMEDLPKLERKAEGMEDLPKLERKAEGMEDLPKLEIVVSAPEARRPEQAAGTKQPGQADEEDMTDLSGETETAQPLFKDVKAAPVKVGENFRLDTRQPDMDDQLANTVRLAAQQGLREIEIRLSPENLGNLTVKLTQAADGALQVVLRAANPKAASLLDRHIDSLNTALQGYGQSSEVRVEVQRNEDSQQAQQQQQQTDPNGHNRQSQQQERQRREEEHSGDFLQKLRLGLFGTDGE